MDSKDRLEEEWGGGGAVDLSRRGERLVEEAVDRLERHQVCCSHLTILLAGA